MPAAMGRREANKEATRAALTAAARQLFADRGYQATTVRDIARAAQVTERTFYRYFDGKEGLLDEQYVAWLTLIRDAILARPDGEEPMAAIQGAMVGVAQRAATREAPAPIWLFSEFNDRPPRARGRRPALRPLVRLEAVIAEALLARMSAGRQSDGEDEFRAQVIARVAVAVFRTAMIRHRRALTSGGEAAALGVEQLLNQAFAIITDR